MNHLSSPLLSVLMFTAALALSGCASQQLAPAQPVLPFQQAQQLNTQLEQHLESPTKASAEKIAEGYQSLLRHSPGYLPAATGLYRLKYFEFSEAIYEGRNTAQQMAELEQLYGALPSVIKAELNPPALIPYQYELARYLLMKDYRWRMRYVIATGQTPPELTLSAIHPQLLDALQQSPHNTTVRLMLARHHQLDNNSLLTIAQLREAAQAFPEQSAYPSSLGDLFYQQAWQNGCAQAQSSTLSQAAKYYKQALQLTPQDAAALHQQLALTYGLLGVKPLALNEAKSLLGSANRDALWHAALIFSRQGRMDLAQQAFDEANNLQSNIDKPVNRTYIDFLMINGRWREAAQHYPAYLRSKETDSWDLLYAYLIWSTAYASDKNLTFEQVWLKPEPKAIEQHWPGRLYALLKGKATYEQLLTQAQSSCQRAQLDFFAGYLALATGAKLQAIEHGQKVQQANVHLQLEQHLAKQLLQ